ncbi:hypothetical protein BELL_0581g00070 [Botrytis elliptica]|uniref:Uncharacterized protein n=1 Tax=Botrytis elliptica TaxID=278938 RepID=A0A4Z1JQ01_9HELO|nr:hypothetical protein BELL_0581g00070 [Botrytis elliptica]
MKSMVDSIRQGAPSPKSGHPKMTLTDSSKSPSSRVAKIATQLGLLGWRPRAKRRTNFVASDFAIM